MVIDDLMSAATKDTRICDLFTKGSHHRNLSVLCLLQNMYYHGRENRSMSLNSHYLVLFKNPRDQQQIMVLARQMYPDNSQGFLTAYRGATEKPYGHLVVDLKPDTPDDQRLRPNVLADTDKDHEVEVSVQQLPPPPPPPPLPDGTNFNYPVSAMAQQQQQPSAHHLDPGPPGKRHTAYTVCDVLDELRQLRRDIKPDPVLSSPYFPRRNPFDDSESEAELGIQQLMRPEESQQKEFDPASINMPSCDDCGAYYATLPDLRRHNATNCPVSSSSTKSNNSNDGLTKGEKMSFEDEKPLWLDTVKEQLNKEMTKEYNARIREMVEKEGKSEEVAQNKAFNEYVPKLRKSFRHALGDYLILVRKILNTELYQKLMQTAENLMEEDGYGLEEAIRQALKQRKFILDQIIAEKEVQDDDDETETETEEEESE